MLQIPVAGSAFVCSALLACACASGDHDPGDAGGGGVAGVAGTSSGAGNGGSRAESGAGNSGGSPNAPSGGSLNASSGGSRNGPSAGDAGSAGTGAPGGPGKSGAAFVSGGELMTSPNYRLISTMGESLGGTRVLSSKNFEIVGGLVGATQP